MNNSTMEMGNLYDVNKEIMESQKPISLKEWNEKSKEIVAFCEETNNQYYMLLNRETNNFTLFDFRHDSKRGTLNTIRLIYDDLKICLQNRGYVLSIDKTQNGDAYEIWIRDKVEGNILVYYFFPYDIGVVK